MDEKRPKGPYIWITWLSKVLSGDTTCMYQPWMKTHFKYDKLEEDDASAGRLKEWKANHERVVRARADELTAEGWHVTLEDQNKIEIDGEHAMVSGKPDIIAVNDTEVRVEDVKTGKRRDSDWWQVLIYLCLGPRMFPRTFAGKEAVGLVLYNDEEMVVDETAFATPENIERIWAQVIELATMPEPEKRPSWHECRFCDIASCDARVSGRRKPASSGGLF